MKKITVILPHIKPLKTRKRVAAYARVSMECERLMHSLSAQISYYNELIQSNSEWEYAGVYADNFISGTSSEKRPEFQRLLRDCDDGKIDIILCKSISRFARNTVDLLETVRHLRDKGIEVRFEKERINSLSEDGEIMLTLLASFAQEESISISENSKWGIRETYRKGTDGVRNKKVFGYRYDGGKYVIVPEEAELVRYIFKRYLDGVGYRTIENELREKGYNTTWVHVRYILSNEIYIGDRLLQKVYVTDPITKRKIKNRSELAQYLIKDCHEPIIEHDIFDAVQKERARRDEAYKTSVFTHIMKCAECGRFYVRKITHTDTKDYVSWICGSKKGGKCDSGYISEERLMKISAKMLESDVFDEDVFSQNILSITVYKNGDLKFHFFNGTEKMWKNLLNTGHNVSDHTEFFRDKIICGCCGEKYHRVNSANKWVYWYCIGKKRKASKSAAHSVNYNESDLVGITEYVLGDMDAFNEVENITVMQNGDLIYNFKDGRNVKWERM